MPNINRQQEQLMASTILTNGNLALSHIHREPSFERAPYFLLNEKLDDIRLPHEINEACIEGFLGILEDSGNSHQLCHF